MVPIPTVSISPRRHARCIPLMCSHGSALFRVQPSANLRLVRAKSSQEGLGYVPKDGNVRPLASPENRASGTRPKNTSSDHIAVSVDKHGVARTCSYFAPHAFWNSTILAPGTSPCFLQRKPPEARTRLSKGVEHQKQYLSPP